MNIAGGPWFARGVVEASRAASTLATVSRSESAVNRVNPAEAHQMAKSPTPDIASLGVRERMLLFCVGSGTDYGSHRSAGSGNCTRRASDWS
jgi:hypothetical protein